jgi:hypothetical protein
MYIYIHIYIYIYIYIYIHIYTYNCIIIITQVVPINRRMKSHYHHYRSNTSYFNHKSWRNICIHTYIYIHVCTWVIFLLHVIIITTYIVSITNLIQITNLVYLALPLMEVVDSSLIFESNSLKVQVEFCFYNRIYKPAIRNKEVSCSCMHSFLCHAQFICKYSEVLVHQSYQCTYINLGSQVQ